MKVATESPLLEQLKVVLAEIADLYHAQQILEWDARVSMPRAGAAARADVASTVTQLAHGRFISDEVGKLLDDLDTEGHDSDSVEAALIRITRRDWERAARIPSELAGEMVQVSGVAVAAWDEAKAASDFESFSPHLERQLELKRRYIACFPETEDPYDVLLDEYEEGLTTAQLEEIFGRLKGELVRTTFQLRLFADEVDAGAYLHATIDHADRRSPNASIVSKNAPE